MDRRAGKKVKIKRSEKSEVDSSLNDLFAVFYEAKEAEGRAYNTLQ